MAESLTGHSKGIPIEDMIHYSERGLSHAEIGQMVGCSAANVTARFGKVGYTPERLKAYKLHRADIFTEKQRQIMDAISPEKLKKSTAYQLVGMGGILYDKERLERGESTQNIAYADMAKNSDNIDTEIETLETEIMEMETAVARSVETPFETAKRQENEAVKLLPAHTQTVDKETATDQVVSVISKGQ